MSTPRSFSATAVLDAPPDDVYRIIADYRDGHTRIIPRPPFETLEIEEGGFGAGTVIRVHVRVLGRAQTYRAIVTEPDPGRVLVETNDTGYVTTFFVEPLEGGRRSRVTITTEREGRSGVVGAMQHLLISRLMRPVFVRELGLLEAEARKPAA